MAVVYKLNRSDGLSYIGMTVDINKRLTQHKRSKRFSEHNLVSHEIIFEGSYEECQIKEEYFIRFYNTFKNGLNVTLSGKGKSECDDFNTYGFKYSDESRQKMSDNQWLKNGGKPWNKGKKGCFSDDTLKKMSDSQKNREVFYRILSTEDYSEICNRYKNRVPIPKDFIVDYLKKSDRQLYMDGIKKVNDCSFKNGKKFNYRAVFSHFIAQEYKCTANNIILVIKDET